MEEHGTFNAVVGGSSPPKPTKSDSANSLLYGLRNILGSVAQLVEREPEELRVPGSIPGGPTTKAREWRNWQTQRT